MIIIANVMLPSVAEHIVILGVLMLPITLIEGIFICKYLRLPFAESTKLSFGANLKSTFIGIPLGYIFALFGVIPAGIFMNYLPVEIGRPLSVVLLTSILHGGTIPTAFDDVAWHLGTLLILIPYWFVTVSVEKKYLLKRVDIKVRERVLPIVKTMNLFTYTLLATPIVIGLLQILN